MLRNFYSVLELDSILALECGVASFLAGESADVEAEEQKSSTSTSKATAATSSTTTGATSGSTTSTSSGVHKNKTKRRLQYSPSPQPHPKQHAHDKPEHKEEANPTEGYQPTQTIYTRDGQTELLYIREVPDGNCFYRALARAIKGDANQHPQVREGLCNYMVRTNTADEFLDDLEIHINNQRQLGEYADAPEVAAAAEFYQINIEILNRTTGKWNTDHIHVPIRQPRRVLYLIHGGAHYDTLVPEYRKVPGHEGAGQAHPCARFALLRLTRHVIFPQVQEVASLTPKDRILKFATAITSSAKEIRRHTRTILSFLPQGLRRTDNAVRSFADTRTAKAMTTFVQVSEEIQAQSQTDDELIRKTKTGGRTDDWPIRHVQNHSVRR